MEDETVGFIFGFIAAAAMGLFVWGNIGVSVATGSAERTYAKQHCEAKCAPTTPHFKAELVDGKFICTCLVTP